MAELIEFYVPRKHKPLRKYVPEAMRGKILEFKKPTPTIAGIFHGILAPDRRRFSDDKI